MLHTIVNHWFKKSCTINPRLDVILDDIENNIYVIEIEIFVSKEGNNIIALKE